MNAATITARPMRPAATLALRAVLFASGVAGFVGLILAARQFGHDNGMLGLSNDTVHLIGHLTVPGFLAVLFARATRHSLLAWTVAMLLSTAEELHQLFVPFRCCCWEDWATNVLSITIWLVAAHLLAGKLHPALKHTLRKLSGAPSEAAR